MSTLKKSKLVKNEACINENWRVYIKNIHPPMDLHEGI